MTTLSPEEVKDAYLASYLRQGFRIIGTAQRHTMVHGRLIDEVLMECEL